jgi:hypothetical protein
MTIVSRRFFLSLIICTLPIHIHAWINENHPNACQHGPWSGRLQRPEKMNSFLVHENLSTVAIPAEFVIVSHYLTHK